MLQVQKGKQTPKTQHEETDRAASRTSLLGNIKCATAACAISAAFYCGAITMPTMILAATTTAFACGSVNSSNWSLDIMLRTGACITAAYIYYPPFAYLLAFTSIPAIQALHALKTFHEHSFAFGAIEGACAAASTVAVGAGLITATPATLYVVTLAASVLIQCSLQYLSSSSSPRAVER